MEKWADYCISAVRYDENYLHAAKLRVHADKGSSLGKEETWSRDKIIAKMDEGSNFTVVRNGHNGDWEKGPDIKIITVDEKRFLRTDEEIKKADYIEIHFLII